MSAVRESTNPLRTLDAFWRGQINSKSWLIENLHPFVDRFATVDIHGGWVGVLASMMFQSSIPIKKIRSIDIDPNCEATARTMNMPELLVGKFEAVTADMCDMSSQSDVIINTSCEHITQEQYDKWLSNMPDSSLLVLQGNNYDIPEHVRTSKSLDEFVEQCKIKVSWKGELELPLYTRYMIIGEKWKL